LSKEHYERLKLLVTADENNCPINRHDLHRLLGTCFPQARRALRDYAEERGLERWARATVAACWRHNHNAEGECAVRRATIIEVGEATILARTDNGEIVHVSNLYSLPIQSGSIVYFHIRVIADIDENQCAAAA